MSYFLKLVDLHFEVICDVSTRGSLPIDNVVMSWFFEIDMKELKNVNKSSRRRNKHVNMLEGMHLINGGTFKAFKYKKLLWICLKM
jgi:hypothetical protein